MTEKEISDALDECLAKIDELPEEDQRYVWLLHEGFLEAGFLTAREQRILKSIWNQMIEWKRKVIQ